MISVETYMSLRRDKLDNFAQRLEETFKTPGFSNKIKSSKPQIEAVTQILLFEAELHNKNHDRYAVDASVKNCFFKTLGWVPE